MTWPFCSMEYTKIVNGNMIAENICFKIAIGYYYM